VRPISLYEFGGQEDTVRRIQRPLVQFFRGYAPVLDIGCGRGIFLELLASADIEAVGIDHSEESLAACRSKGFEVYCEDAPAYLQRTSEQFGGIFCSHVIEHMSYQDALGLLKLCYSALRVTGLLLLITPNPQDISVISETFWLDPTHVRPYPAPLLQSMLESVGFQVQVAKRFLGNWRMVGRRNLPGYLFRRMILGRYYGKPNTLMLATKSTPVHRHSQGKI
jgi:2-polyprenyl-3-methyl-5-hydroxy-6-metoxy-1,4-benzoquinol methylase